MIAIYILCTICIFIASAIVLLPLTKPTQKIELSTDGFADEDELRRVLTIRDALLDKLILGNTSEKMINELDEEKSLEALFNICRRLQRAGLKYLPVFLMAILPFVAKSQEHADFRLPPATEVNGYQLAKLNQFVVAPASDGVIVRYMGVFANHDRGKTLKVLLPMPSGLQDLRLAKLQNAIVNSDSNSNAIVEIQNSPNVIEIQAEGFLPAKFGKVHWQNKTLPTLPGTTLIMMSEYEGGLRNFLNIFKINNVWPARFSDEPEGFTSRRELETYDPREPNYHLLAKLPPQMSRRLIRLNVDNAPYPSFSIVGLVPPRAPLFALAAAFCVILFSSGVSVVFRKTVS